MWYKRMGCVGLFCDKTQERGKVMIQEKLLERKLPELLKMNNGDPVTAENWEERRKEQTEF